MLSYENYLYLHTDLYVYIQSVRNIYILFLKNLNMKADIERFNKLSLVIFKD